MLKLILKNVFIINKTALTIIFDTYLFKNICFFYCLILFKGFLKYCLKVKKGKKKRESEGIFIVTDKK